MSEQCPCGEPLHYRTPGMQTVVEDLIRAVGPTVPVTVGNRTWEVPRHYIALHGLRADNLAALADHYGFLEVLKVPE